MTLDDENLDVFGFGQPKHGPKVKNFTFTENVTSVVETSFCRDLSHGNDFSFFDPDSTHDPSTHHFQDESTCHRRERMGRAREGDVLPLSSRR